MKSIRTNQPRKILKGPLGSELEREDLNQEEVISAFYSSLSNHKVIITIPAYNEEDSIGDVINEINQVMKKTHIIYQIMVLDDGSIDKTEDITKNTGVLYFTNGINRGLAHTFKKEMEICCNLGADIIVHTDADGQYPAIYIPKMIQSVMEGSDLVLGSRFGEGIYSGSISKNLGNQFFAKVLSILLRKNIHDTTTGFRAFTREIAQLPIESKFTYTQEQLIRTLQSKKNVKEIPIIARKTRESRLFNNIIEYFYRAIVTIFKIFM